MLPVEDWAEIRRLHRAEGLPIKMIAFRNLIKMVTFSSNSVLLVQKKVNLTLLGKLL